MNTIKQTPAKRGWRTVRTVVRLWAASLVTALTLAALASCAAAGAGSTDDDPGSEGDGTGSRPELKENAGDIAPGGADSSPYGFFGFDGLVYFGADDGTHGEELWAYDGTSASMVADIYTGSSSSSPDDFVVYDSTLYFQAEDSANGMELWKISSGDAVLAEDINSGAGDGHWGHPVVYEDDLYFQGDDGSNRKNLYRYDGATVEFVDTVTSGYPSSPSHSTLYDGKLFFYAEENGGTDNSDAELYLYDVEDGSIELPQLEEVNPDPGSSLPEVLIVYDGLLYFEADSGDGAGRELHRYDPADENGDNSVFERVTSVRSGDAQIGNLVVYGGDLYFTAYNGVHRYIYRYDGSSTTKLEDIVDGHTPYYPGSLEVYDGLVYFGADDGTHGDELWRYDGSSAELVWDINEGGDGSYPYDLTAIGTRLYFSADDGATGDELFSYQSPR